MDKNIGAYDFMILLQKQSTAKEKLLLLSEYINLYEIHLARKNIPFGYSYFLNEQCPIEIMDFLKIKEEE